MPVPLEDVLPHEPERSEAQVRGVVDLLKPPVKRVLDLGCGTGRLVVPLARAGHRVVGVDCVKQAMAECREALQTVGAAAELIEGDFMQWLRREEDAEPFDAILCLGNTFMTIADLDDVLELLVNTRKRLTSGGVFIIDDLPHDLWPLLTEGNWASGVSEDGSMQLIWHEHDAVFTIRRGESVDPESWTLKPSDDLLRLWTSGCLSLAARLAGLSEPQHRADSGLLVLRAG